MGQLTGMEKQAKKHSTSEATFLFCQRRRSSLYSVKTRKPDKQAKASGDEAPDPGKRMTGENRSEAAHLIKEKSMVLLSHSHSLVS